MGVAVQYNQDKGRYLVHMVSNQSTMAFKPENLEKAGMIDSAKAQMEMIRKDPNIQREIQKYYNLAQQKLGGIKPEYAAGGVLVVFVLCMYFVGIAKSFMALSLLLLLGLIVGQDVMQGLSARTVAENFPRRCREAIEMNAPFLRGKINNLIAAGIVGAMLGLGFMSLFVGSSAAKAAAVSSSSSTIPSGGAVASRASLERAYKLGFDDGNDGLDFGTSLAKILGEGDDTAVPDMPGDIQDDPMEFQDTRLPPVPPSPRKSFFSSFGITQAMSAFYVYRMVMEMGTDPSGASGFSPERLVANLQTVGVWKLGILGFSLFNLVKPFIF